MHKTFGTFLFASLFTTSLFATNLAGSFKTLSTYSEIRESLVFGIGVYVSVDVSKCSFKPGYNNTAEVLTMGIQIPELYERFSTTNGGKKMRVIVGASNAALYGQEVFQWTRDISLLFEDGTVMVIDDNVDPITFKLVERSWINCKLSVDGSGGVLVIQKL